MLADEFVDATVFIGMHSVAEADRAACTSFFAERIDGRVLMSLEQVGRCDHVIWGRSREQQDAYYPFMDNLHTEMDIVRLGYREQDVTAAWESTQLAGLSMADRLSLGMVLSRGGVLYSLSADLLARPALPVLRPPGPGAHRTVFPAVLEQLYQASLTLLVDIASLSDANPDRQPCTAG